jgi:hypothetical protein
MRQGQYFSAHFEFHSARQDQGFLSHFKQKLPDAELIYREHVRGVELIHQQGISSSCNLSFQTLL